MTDVNNKEQDYDNNNMENTNMTDVNNQTNIEIVQGYYKQYEETLSRLLPDENSLQVYREVRPDEDNFKNTQMCINTLLGANIKKVKNSTDLIKTLQEVRFITENDEEQSKLDVLLEDVRYPISTLEFNKEQLSKLFSDKSSHQRIIANGEVNTDKLNLINPFTKGIYLTAVGNFNSQFSLRWCLLNEHNSGDETNVGYILQQDSRLWREHRNGYGYSTSVVDTSKISFDKLFRFFEKVSNDAIKIPYDADEKESEEIFNSFSMDNYFKPFEKEIVKINKKIDEFEKDISISLNDFLTMFPEVSKTLDNLIEEQKQKEIRISKLVNNKVNMNITFNADVDVKSLGDVEDIKDVISKHLQKQNISLNGNVHQNKDEGSAIFNDARTIVSEMKINSKNIIEIKEIA